jgi:cholesterol oxidase
MTGCRVGAKNTLVKNYLYLAEQAGAVVHPLTTVTAVRPQPDGTWCLDAVRTGQRWRRTVRANQVVLSAGTWGTQQLLHRMRDSGVLSRLSPRLGELSRSNSEAIVGASRIGVDPQRDYSHGVAITSSFYPDEHTHIEPVRYGRGSNAMGMLQTVSTDGASDTPRWRQLVQVVARHPVRTARLLSLRRWSERTVILLVMQTLDNSLTTYRHHGRLTSRRGSRRAQSPLHPGCFPGQPADRRMHRRKHLGGVVRCPDHRALPRWLPDGRNCCRRRHRRLPPGTRLPGAESHSAACAWCSFGCPSRPAAGAPVSGVASHSPHRHSRGSRSVPP